MTSLSNPTGYNFPTLQVRRRVGCVINPITDLSDDCGRAIKSVAQGNTSAFQFKRSSFSAVCLVLTPLVRTARLRALRVPTKMAIFFARVKPV